MDVLVVLFHYGDYKPLWQQPSLIQAGPNIQNSNNGINVAEASLVRRIDGSSGISIMKDPTCDQLVISKSNGNPLIVAT